MKLSKYVKEEEEFPQELLDNPYKYICDYVESIYPKIGRKTFEVLSLMPCSLIIPDLFYGSKKVRTNIHALFLTGSGGGKTSIAELFSNLTFSPLKFESITSARMETAIAQNPIFSLIVGDFARMSKDPILIKVIEGLLGEEKRIQRATMQKDIDIEVEGISLLCGISTDLSHYIFSGLIFRVVPILIGHNCDEHSEIGNHIKTKIGNRENSDTEKIIRKYYMKLARIQTDEEKQIKDYHIPKEFRDEAYKKWDKLTKPIVKEIGLNFFRELQEFFRFLCSSAFLNYFNRKVEKNVLYPNEEDFDIALRLMKNSINFKKRLIRSESFAKGIKNAKQFKQIMESDTISEGYKEIIRNLVEIKGKKVAMRNP